MAEGASAVEPVAREKVRIAAAAAAAVVAVGAAGCTHLHRVHMPWAHRSAPAPQAVHELVVTDPAGAAAPFPQYWSRNTLVIDLQGISGTGRIELATPAGTTWPFRLALRVTPGAVGELEVRADQRWVVPLVRTGVKPVDLVIPTGVYSRATARIEVAWEPASEAAAP